MPDEGMSPGERCALVDRDDPDLSVAAQCRLLKVARSTLYYQPAPVAADDLALMRRMDELYTKWPFYGSRRMVAALRQDGWIVNRQAGSPADAGDGRGWPKVPAAKPLEGPDEGWRQSTRSRTPARGIRITRFIHICCGDCRSTGRTRFGVPI
jgi:hypothetical protein